MKIDNDEKLKRRMEQVRFGLRLDRIRKQRGWTRLEMARAMGLSSPSYVTAILDGFIQRPRMDKMVVIAETFNIPINEVVQIYFPHTRKEEMNK